MENGGGGEQPRRDTTGKQGETGIQKKPKRKTAGKLGEMEIWWGRRAAKNGDYRQARRDGNMVGEESSQKGRLQASKERWQYRAAKKGYFRQARKEKKTWG